MFIDNSFFNQWTELGSTLFYKIRNDVTVGKRLYAFW